VISVCERVPPTTPDRSAGTFPALASYNFHTHRCNWRISCNVNCTLSTLPSFAAQRSYPAGPPPDPNPCVRIRFTGALPYLIPPKHCLPRTPESALFAGMLLESPKSIHQPEAGKALWHHLPCRFWKPCPLKQRWAVPTS
jgi:hypothetical protein